MTARYLMTLALALGMGGASGCVVNTTGKDTTPGDDDDDTTGDDDDDNGDPTGDTGVSGPEEMNPTQMTMWAQFGTVGGDVIEYVSDGQNTYYSILVVNIGPDDWDVNDPYDTNYCSIFAPVAIASSGALDAEPVVAPYADVGAKPAAETDCFDYFTLPAGFDPTLLVNAFPDWSVGVAAAITPEMQKGIDQIPAKYHDIILGGYFHIPLLKEPVWETWYSLGSVIEGGGTGLGGEVVRADVTGAAELPDGLYYVDPLLLLDITGIASY
jgi:hypothetical protein